MALPLMPKATAVWLIDNTKLTFDQIAEFCELHKLEVKAIADGEVAIGINGLDPVHTGQLTREEIARAEADPRVRLKMTKSDLPQPVARTKGARYTPVSKRGEKPDAVAFLLKNHPELLDAQIARLLGTTKETIAKVRDRTHWNATNIKPSNPILLGLVKQADLDAAVKRASRRVQRENVGKNPGKSAGNTAKPEQPEEGFVDTGSADGDQQPEIDHDAMMRGLG